MGFMGFQIGQFGCYENENGEIFYPGAYCNYFNFRNDSFLLKNGYQVQPFLVVLALKKVREQI